MFKERSNRIVLEQVRCEKGLSRSDLSRMTKIQAGVISWIEKGRFYPYDSQLSKIADALGWQGNPEDLLEEAE